MRLWPSLSPQTLGGAEDGREASSMGERLSWRSFRNAWMTWRRWPMVQLVRLAPEPWLVVGPWALQQPAVAHGQAECLALFAAWPSTLCRCPVRCHKRFNSQGEDLLHHESRTSERFQGLASYARVLSGPIWVLVSNGRVLSAPVWVRSSFQCSGPTPSRQTIQARFLVEGCKKKKRC